MLKNVRASRLCSKRCGHYDFAQKCPGARKEKKFELRRTVLYVEAQIFSPDAADGRFSTQSRESGGTGRRTGLRIQRATMGVQLPPLAPYSKEWSD